MTKRGVTLLLAAHIAICWTAVVLRSDRFPLTWTPMYSTYSPPKAEYHLTYRDKDWLKNKGWLATRRDGTTEQITQRDVNLPTRNMWRLYYQRTNDSGPPKYSQMNSGENTIDRWLWGLEPGEKYYDIDWHRRLLVSINKTFDRHPDDSDFIISLEAKVTRYKFDSQTLEYKGTKEKVATATWKDDWKGDF